MIIIDGKQIIPNSIDDFNFLGDKEREIVEKMHTNAILYGYDSIPELVFEIRLRVKIMEASILLNNSRFKFSTFRKSTCNKAYWDRTDEGGFRKKSDTNAYDAINDIFKNGRKYASECATAIIIIYYKAIGDLFPKDIFNQVFESIYLMNWKEIDDNMGVSTYRFVPEPLPGDCLYFANPDVDPLTPEFQGENTIYHGGDKYYGHGIGIKSKQSIINVLNEYRKSDATKSAFLLKTATRLNFLRLFSIYENGNIYNMSA